MKSNNIELISPFEINIPSNLYIEFPTFYLSSADTGIPVSSSGSGSNNPGVPEPSSDSGSNSPGNPDPVEGFEAHRRVVGAKLRALYVNKPPGAMINMSNPHYSDRISAWDHNVVCRSLMDARHNLLYNIVNRDGHIRYDGVISIRLLNILERDV